MIDFEGPGLLPGKVGEIAVRGCLPNLFRGYWKNERATRRCRLGNCQLSGDRD